MATPAEQLAQQLRQEDAAAATAAQSEADKQFSSISPPAPIQSKVESNLNQQYREAIAQNEGLAASLETRIAAHEAQAGGSTAESIAARENLEELQTVAADQKAKLQSQTAGLSPEQIAELANQVDANKEKNDKALLNSLEKTAAANQKTAKKKKKRGRKGPSPKPVSKIDFLSDLIDAWEFDSPRHSPFTLGLNLDSGLNTANVTDPWLKLVYEQTMGKKLPLPTEWIARVLKVTISVDRPENWWTGNDQSQPFYKIRARRIQPTGDWQLFPGTAMTNFYNPDTAIKEPCSEQGGGWPDAWAESHPLYTPTDIKLRIPRPGDLINIKIDNNLRKGSYTGFAVGRTLAALQESIKAGKLKTSKLKDGYPSSNPNKVDEDGCATNTISDEQLNNLSRIYGKNRYYKHRAKLRDNTKRFLYELNQQAARNSTSFKITSTVRGSVTQAGIMYGNWINAGDDAYEGQTGGSSSTSEAAKNAEEAARTVYLLDLYKNWKGKDEEEMLALFKTIRSQGGWAGGNTEAKNKAVELAESNKGGHSRGTEIDISFSAPKAGSPSRNWLALKGAARRCCCWITIEKDHWHISATPGRKKWGWNSKSYGRKHNFLKTAGDGFKGPSKEKKE